MQKILVKNFDLVSKAFLVDAGNRYVLSFEEVEGKWVCGGGHVWQTGSPRLTHIGTSLYLNPNTGERQGAWAEAWLCFMPEPSPEAYSPEWAEAIWASALETKKALEKGVTPSELDKSEFRDWPEKDLLNLNTPGKCYLHHLWLKCGRPHPCEVLDKFF